LRGQRTHRDRPPGRTAGLVPSLPAQERNRRLDVPGAVLLIASVMGVITGTSLAERPGLRMVGAAAMAGGLILAIRFAIRQRRATTPLVPAAAFASAPLQVGSVVSFVNTATTSSAGVLATLLLQQQLGVTPIRAALMLMPFSLGVIVGSMVSGPLARQLAPRRLAGLGLGTVAVGNLTLALTAGTKAGIVAGVVLAGMGGLRERHPRAVTEHPRRARGGDWRQLGPHPRGRPLRLTIKHRTHRASPTPGPRRRTCPRGQKRHHQSAGLRQRRTR
jgi:hypothetical protein